MPGQAPAAAQAEASSTPKRATQPRPHTLVAQVVALLEVHGVLSAAQIQTLLPADRAERAASNGLLRATHAGLVCSVKVPGQRTLLYHAATRTVTDAEIAKALRANGWDGASPEEGRGVPPPDSPSKPEPAVDETRPADPVAKPELSGPQPFRLPGADHCDTRDDPVGLYARVCAVTDDTSDLITDGLARNLAPHVLQALLAAQQQLNRAARAIARNLA